MSTGVAPAEVTTRPARIGSFAILERLTLPDAPVGQITLKVAGLPGSQHEGTSGIATCFPAPKSDEAIARVQALLDALKAVGEVALCPVADAAVAGSIVYWVRPMQVGDKLSDLSDQLTIRELGQMVARLGSALSVAAKSSLSHGSIHQKLILRNPDDGWVLSGLGIMGRGEAQDQRDLALVVIARLSNRVWAEPDLSGYPEEERPYHRSQRLREHLANHTERVANVLIKATHPDPSSRYAGIGAFAEDFVQQIRLSADDLVHGAFEAISARNIELARIMGEKAATYEPDLENLAILRLQLSGKSMFAGQPSSPPAPGVPFGTPSHEQATGLPGFAMTMPDATQPDAVQSLSHLPPELIHGLPPEFLQAIAPQFEVKPVKKGVNPLFILLLGGLGVVLLLLIAAMLTIFASGS